jgi:hypothetical protein
VAKKTKQKNKKTIEKSKPQKEQISLSTEKP